MHCRNCGSEVPEDSLFCIHCGERVDAMPPAPQVQYANPMPMTLKKSLSNKKKALIFGGAGAVLLAVVLILVFTLSGGGGPLSGNTVQTRFVNENARFLAAMLEDFKVGDTSRMMTEPFEYTVNISLKADGRKSEQEVAMAYDRQALGISVDSDYSTVTLLLAESLIVDTNGYVQIYETDSEANLDAAMTLKDRISALFDTGDAKVDYKKLVEMFVNSIPEDCFKKTGDSFTLTFEVDDLVDTLNAFADSLEKDKDMDEAFRDVIKEVTDRSRKLSDLAEEAADQLDAISGMIDFELVWELSYDKGAPSAMNVSLEGMGDYSDFTLSMEYENRSSGKDIAIEYETPAGYSDFSIDMTTKRTGKGLEFEGDVRAGYDKQNKTSFEGVQKVEGEKFSLEMTTDYSGSTYSYTIEGTIHYGMPDKDVKSDRRFKIDTDDAYYSDMSDIF